MRAIELLNPFYVFRRRHLVRPYLKRRLKWQPTLRALDRILTLAGLPITANSRRLAALRNRHRGQRCFVIGNGPSLLTGDLDRLKNEITIASNKIYLAFGQTDWRPTYYTAIDTVVMGNAADVISSLPFPKIFPRGTEHIVGVTPETMFCDLGVDWVDIGDFRPGFSPDLRHRIFGGECVTYFNIQVAYYLGCREIYLLGVDFSFVIPKKKVADKGYEFILESEGEQNHFVKDYRPVGEKWTMPHLREQRMAFEYCREYVRQHGGAVYNASRKSELDVFERVDFDALFVSK